MPLPLLRFRFLTSRRALVAGALLSVLAAGSASADAPSAALRQKAAEAASLLATARTDGEVRVLITLAMPGNAPTDDDALRARVRETVPPFVDAFFGAAGSKARGSVTTMPFLPIVAGPVSATLLERIAADPRVVHIDRDGVSSVNTAQ